MKKCLPRNLICLDFLVGPFSLEHPREIFIFSPHPPTTSQVLQSICKELTTGPMVPLAPFCPRNPISPRSPTGPVSPRWPWWPLLPWRETINEQVCSECTNFPEQYLGCLTIQTFNTESLLDKHLQCHAYGGFWPHCLLLQQRTIQLPFIHEWKVYFSPEQVNWQTFSPGFPLSPISPGLPSWPL